MTIPVTSQKRKRLSKKQLWFLNDVFEGNSTVDQALREHHIRPATLDNWLTKPLFLNRLRMHLNHYYLQARLEMARSAPMAIEGLSFLSNRSFKHKEVRQACNDLLKFHNEFAKSAAAKQAKSGARLDKFGVVLEQFGVILDNNGVSLDKLGDSNSLENAAIDTKNADNTQNRRLIASTQAS